ncbi:MAG TPA: hypothetical protein VFV32_01620 [Acidimicrobiales bacterium]|nr:hypothetical protein [Acidimicrobiales bacterium]
MGVTEATPGARSAWQASAAALGVATIVVMAGWGGPRTGTAVADLAAVVTALGGAAVLLRASNRPGRTTARWRLLGVAMVLWGAGEVLWSWDEVVLGREVPFPSLADVAYLGAVPFAVAGLLAFARGTRARIRVRTVLDGCLVASSLLFITWALVLGPVWRSDAGSPWANAISVAYPVTDLVLVVLALVLVQWSATGQRAALHTAASGLVVMAVTDSAFTWLTNAGTYSSTNPITMLWPASAVTSSSCWWRPATTWP